MDVFKLRDERAALRRSKGRFRFWGTGSTSFGYGTPAQGSFSRAELNKVSVVCYVSLLFGDVYYNLLQAGKGRYYAPGSLSAQALKEKWGKRSESRQRSRKRRLRRNRKRDRRERFLPKNYCP